jgi:transposase-like protein
MNATLSLVQQTTSSSEVLARLMRRFGLSRRQAYRYLRQAQLSDSPVPVPEPKAVFTVKLPCQLMVQVRQIARREGSSISLWVERVLRQALKPPKGHG